MESRTKHSESSILSFGIFELELRNHVLRKAGVPVKIQEQPLKLLELLAEGPGEIVSRDEIRQALWGNDTYVNFERSINFCVNQIRTALGDDAEAPRFVQTVPRRGYRFIATLGPAAILDEPRLEARPAEAAQQPERSKGTRRSIALSAAGVGILAIILFTVVLQSRPPTLHSIAVLPLANLSGDPSQDWLVDGLTEELTTDLGRMSSLRVVSRRSSMRFKDSKKSIPEIARELNVDAVIEGSVTRVGNRVRVTAQLIQAATDRHLWASSYERDSHDILALQDEVARGIARETGVRLTPSDHQRRAASVSPEAYEAYLKGRFFLNERTDEGFRQAITWFRRAIEIDPSYAEPYTGLSDAYSLGYLKRPPKEVIGQAKDAVQNALQLDDSLGEAHASLAMIRFYYDRDWPGAEKEFKLAMELNPNYPSAPGWYGLFLAWMSRPDECIAAVRRAKQLDPLTPIIQVQVANCYLWSRRYDQAIALYREALDLDPDFWIAHEFLGECYEKKNMRQEAMQHYLRGEPEGGRQELRKAYQDGGWEGFWRQRLEFQLAAHSRGKPMAYAIAQTYARLNQRDQAFHWLDRSLEDRELNAGRTKVDPILDPLRSDPRFIALLMRLGFAA